MSTIFAAALTDDVAKFDSVIASDFYIFDGGARFNGDSVTAFIKAQRAAGKRKENAPEFDYSSFYAKTGARDPLLFGRSPAFLMTRLRTATHEETELLTVLYFPFRVRTP